MRNGHIKRITDPDIASSVLEIMGTNVSTNFITCPLDPKKTLAIKLPFLVMIIKNVSSSSNFWLMYMRTLCSIFCYSMLFDERQIITAVKFKFSRVFCILA